MNGILPLTRFIHYKMNPTKNIGSSPTIIFGNDYTCRINSIVLTSIIDEPMTIYLYIAREVTVGTETDFMFDSGISLENLSRIEALKDTNLTLEAGDLLYAYSDFSSHLFNSFVNYEQLTEL